MTNELDSTQDEYEKQSNALSSATELLHNLLIIQCKLSPSDSEKMESVWSAEITADTDEVNKAALTFVL